MPLPAEILKDPDNKVCADCGRHQPTWASVNIGIMICEVCSGIHRSIGVHITFVQSATIDDWKPEWVETLRAIGNRRAKEYYEANVPEAERFQGPVDLVGGDKMDEKEGRKLKKWIRAKYEEKKYAPKGVEEPYKRLAKGEKLDGGGGGKKKKDKKEKAEPVVEEAPKGKKEKKSKKHHHHEEDDGGAEQWDQSWQEQQGWEGDAAWDQSNAWQQSAGGNEGWGGGEEAWGAEAWNGAGTESWGGGGAAWGAESQYPGGAGCGGYDAGAAGGYAGAGYDGSPAAAGGYGCGAGYDGSAAATGGYGCGAGYDGSAAAGYCGSGYDTADPAAGGYGGYDASPAAAGGYCPSPAGGPPAGMPVQGSPMMANGGGTSFQMSNQEAAYERSQALQSISKLFLDPSFLGVPPHVQLIRPFGFDLHTSSIDHAALRKHKAHGASFNSLATVGLQGAANCGYPGSAPALPPYYPTS